MKKIIIIPLLFLFYIGIGQSINSNFVIGKPIMVEKLTVAQHDFQNKLNWDEAIAACKKLGEGWRLPNKSELNTLFKYKSEIGGFSTDWYWSSTEEYNDAKSPAWKQSFPYWRQAISHKNIRYKVRAVKTL